MIDYLLLLIEAVTSITASLLVLHALSCPLMNVLSRLCPDESTATFWLSYTRIMLLIAPLLLVLTVNMFAHFSDPLDTWRFSLITILAGILIGLYMLGERLGQFIVPPQKAGDAS